MLGRAKTARIDFGIRLGMGTCGHDTSHQFGERLLVRVEEHGATSCLLHWRQIRQHVIGFQHVVFQ